MHLPNLHRSARLVACLAVSAAGMLVSPLPAGAQAAVQPHACGPIAIPMHYGPYDYRTERARLTIVEIAHFTPRVEALLGGSTGDLNKDLNYTLLSSPNHHRALIALAKLSERHNQPQLPGFDFPIECYFERAIRFRQDDPVVRMIYARHLNKLKRVEDAVRQVKAASEMAPDNPFTQFNAGLVFFELGDFGNALKRAHRAREMGFERKDLEEMLRGAGKWEEPKP